MVEVCRFYCCYLLQSINKRKSFYVGSTPNPEKRLRQHNGSLVNGGAYRTKRLGTRPWEMVMIVYGFPNKITALQFEHAWQHGYQTHFIEPEDRIVKHKNAGRSMKHKLGLVRQLLQHPFFQYMNLKVHFFNKDTMQVWSQNEFHLDVPDVNNIYISINALQNMKSTELSVDDVLNYAQENLDLVSKLYNDDKDTFDTAIEYFVDILSNGYLKCDICQGEFDYTSEDPVLKPFIAFCPRYEECKFHSHLKCLSKRFLTVEKEREKHNPPTFIPKGGQCPGCNITVKWSDIIRYSCQLKSQYTEI